MNSCIIVFAKEPERTKVKTRLEVCMSVSDCLNLYKAFLKDTIDMVKSVRCDRKILAYKSKGNPRYLKKIAPGFLFYKQRGRSLGQKMSSAMKDVFEGSFHKVIIIGTDSPTLPASYIKKAFSHLNKSDIVIGPSCDGGYYLIGLKKPCAQLFKGIRWSLGSVLKDTLRNAKRIKKNVSLLNKWYDIDGSESLEQLKKSLQKRKTAKWTRKFLEI